jgi:phosphoribosylformylglycinamidine cyclo-ligase
VYIGNNKLTDDINDDSFPDSKPISVGKLLLSPTRTFAPLLKLLLKEHFDEVHGLVHCSGGGQTKCLKFIPDQTAVIKDNLFKPPPIFKLIQQSSGADDHEMYQVFNMGCRMEIYTSEEFAETVIEESRKFDIDARIIGRVEASDKKKLTIRITNSQLVFE